MWLTDVDEDDKGMRIGERMEGIRSGGRSRSKSEGRIVQK